MVDRESLVREWVRDAAVDFVMAERALGPGSPLWSMAAFHFQQTAEKLLKSFLTFHGRVFEKTHDLGRLCTMCGEADDNFADLVDRVDQLTDYAVDARYPGMEKPQATDVDEARRTVADVQRLVFELLPTTVRDEWRTE